MNETAFTQVVPAFGIDSYEEAVAHYVDWLGFEIDFEWREAPGKPVIMWVSRPGLRLALNEADGPSRGSWLNLEVADLQGLAAEWNERRPGSVEVTLQAPYEIPSVFLVDPFGNRLNIQQPPTAEEKKAQGLRASEMRRYVRRRLDAGAGCPTPADLVAQVGRPLGLVLEVLGEFPEYRGGA